MRRATLNWNLRQTIKLTFYPRTPPTSALLTLHSTCLFRQIPIWLQIAHVVSQVSTDAHKKTRIHTHTKLTASRKDSFPLYVLKVSVSYKPGNPSCNVIQPVCFDCFYSSLTLNILCICIVCLYCIPGPMTASKERKIYVLDPVLIWKLQGSCSDKS